MMDKKRSNGGAPILELFAQRMDSEQIDLSPYELLTSEIC
jgi:hypothetical protein